MWFSSDFSCMGRSLIGIFTNKKITLGFSTENWRFSEHRLKHLLKSWQKGRKKINLAVSFSIKIYPRRSFHYTIAIPDQLEWIGQLCMPSNEILITIIKDFPHFLKNFYRTSWKEGHNKGGKSIDINQESYLWKEINSMVL